MIPQCGIEIRKIFEIQTRRPEYCRTRQQLEAELTKAPERSRSAFAFSAFAIGASLGFRSRPAGGFGFLNDSFANPFDDATLFSRRVWRLWLMPLNLAPEYQRACCSRPYQSGREWNLLSKIQKSVFYDMKAPKRLLLLEDNPTDAELLRRSLAKERPQCELIQVSNGEHYTAALQKGGFDLILSDYRVPGFEGPEALAVARQHCPTVPFLFVSGAIGDEVAIESLKAGATDYVLNDRLAS